MSTSTAATTEPGPLPPGWDTKYDPRTSRYYFINHYTKCTSWEDPRVRYQQIGKPTSTSGSAATPSIASGGKENKPTVTQTTPSASSTHHHLEASTAASTSGAGSVSNLQQATLGHDNTPLQYYPLGTIPPTQQQQEATASAAASASAAGSSAATTAGPSSTEVAQHIMLQDLNSRKSAGSPAPGRSGSSHPQMGINHNLYSGGVGTGVQASPLPLQRLQLEEAFNLGPPSPIMSQRSSFRRESHVLADISEVEANMNTEQAMHSVSAMFPTVDESHIKELLKKYHGSQAVVISALQVAKHPFIMPGPASAFTPPPMRHSTLPGVSQAVLANIHMTGSLPHYYTASSMMGLRDAPSASTSGYPTPRPGSAASGYENTFSMGSPQIGQPGSLFRSFPKPHSSPKMKLRSSSTSTPSYSSSYSHQASSGGSRHREKHPRPKAGFNEIKAAVSYLKSVFPTVEEYLLLDVLSNSDNNVQKAGDRLVKMGYVKRDTPSAPRLHARRKEEERLAEKRTPLPKPPAIKTDKEKEELRKKMKMKYEVKFEIPERILYMALESVLYDEEQANALIVSMIEDDLKRKKSNDISKAKEKEKKKSPKPIRKVLESERIPRSPKHEPKKPAPGVAHGKKGWSSKLTQHRDSPDGGSEQDSFISTKAKGPNAGLRHGPNDDLLLTDYVTWNGPDPDLRRGTNRTTARGPNRALRCGSVGAGGSAMAKGANKSLSKGPRSGAAKGSIYTQLQEEEDQSTRGN